MKILQINVDANSGSTGRIAEDIGLLIKSKGWESFIAYGRSINPSKSKLIKIGNTFDHYLHALQTRIFDNHGLASTRATKTFLKRISRIQPDIIHLHNLHGYYLNYEILCTELNKMGIPIVWTFHDCWPFTGHCAFPIYDNCEKWMVACKNCTQTVNYPKSYVDRSYNNFFKKMNSFLSLNNIYIVTVSEWLKEQVELSFFKNKSIRCIYNGVDTNLFKPIFSNQLRKKLNICPGRKIVLGVASYWDGRKGLDDFIKLHSLLNDNYQIILVGLTKSQVNELPNGIIGIERTEDVTELVELYSISNVYVNTSIAETFGMTTVEALACGTPAIVYNKTASPEIINDATGRIVETRNIYKLSDAINEISGINRDIIRTECRKRALQLFDKTIVYKQYIDLYDKLLY